MKVKVEFFCVATECSYHRTLSITLKMKAERSSETLSYTATRIPRLEILRGFFVRE
jgi:hypothetical protein